MKIIRLLVLVFLIASVSSICAQVDSSEKVSIVSWKKGIEKVDSQILRINLTQEQPSFEKEISSVSGKLYSLRIVHDPIKELRGEHWKIVLREIFIVNGQRVLGDDMIYLDRPGDIGGDSISRKEYVGIFYPYEKSKVTLNGKTDLFEWRELYPVKTVREIMVDGFCMRIKAGNVDFDPKDETKVKRFELVIELATICGQ